MRQSMEIGEQDINKVRVDDTHIEIDIAEEVDLQDYIILMDFVTLKFSKEAYDKMARLVFRHRPVEVKSGRQKD